MKRVNLVKTHFAPHLAHLYEHLYCYGFEKTLYDNGFFSHIDYEFSAETYHGGWIHLEFVALNKNTETFAETIKSYIPKFSEEAIHKGLQEISAENNAILHGNLKKVTAALQQLQAKPWINIENFGHLDAHDARRDWQTVSLKKAPPKYFKQLTLDIQLYDDNSKAAWQLRPLFYLIANTILDNSVTQLVIHHSAFGIYYPQKITSKLPHISGIVRCGSDAHDNLEKLSTTCATTIKAMHDYDAFSRYSYYLQHSTYLQPFGAPHFIDVFEHTHALIGAKGWKELATIKNISAVLENTSITISTGKDSLLINAIYK